MRPRVIATVCVLLAAGAGVYAQVTQGDALDYLLAPQAQQSYGLYKLDARERQALAALLRTLVDGRRLGDSAVAYLRNEGWTEATVRGTQRLRLAGDYEAKEYWIVEGRAGTYILEPQTFALLLAGTYLGKMGYVSCEIIDTNGRVVRFWTKAVQ